MPELQIDPRLTKDSIPLSDWKHCRVRLMNDTRFPWLLLIPKFANLRDMHDLPDEMRDGVYQEIDQASRALMRTTGADKMNVASLGNMVPQLHVHVIARFKFDAAWPGPVWGVGQPSPYDHGSAEKFVSKFTQALREESY